MYIVKNFELNCLELFVNYPTEKKLGNGESYVDDGSGMSLQIKEKDINNLSENIGKNPVEVSLVAERPDYLATTIKNQETDSRETSIKEFVREFKEDEERRKRAWNNETLNGESGNIYPDVTMSDSEFRDKIIKLILGEDWIVSDPLGPKQVNAIAFMDILDNYKPGNLFLRLLKKFKKYVIK